MTQAEAILRLLQTGATITPREAFERFGCLALHSRAAELRAMGHDVRCRMRSHGGKRWGEYELCATPQE